MVFVFTYSSIHINASCSCLGLTAGGEGQGWEFSHQMLPTKVDDAQWFCRPNLQIRRAAKNSKRVVSVPKKLKKTQPAAKKQANKQTNGCSIGKHMYIGYKRRKKKTNDERINKSNFPPTAHFPVHVHVCSLSLFLSLSIIKRTNHAQKQKKTTNKHGSPV